MERFSEHQNSPEKIEIPLELTPENVLHYPPLGSHTLEEDIAKMKREEINRVILCGPPLAGKSTLATWLKRHVEADSPLSVTVNEIFDQTQFQVQAAAPQYVKDSSTYRQAMWRAISQELTTTLFNEELEPQTLEIIPLPAVGIHDTAISTVETIAEHISQADARWNKTIILAITSPDRITLQKRTAKRRELFREKILAGERPKSLPPEQTIRVYSDQSILVGRFATEHYRDREWTTIRNQILIPEHLRQENPIYTTIYKLHAAYQVYWLYNTLQLNPSRAKVITNPQIDGI